MQEQNLLSLSYGRIVRRKIDSTQGLLPESFETYQIVEPGDVVFRFTDLQNDQRSLRSALVTERGIITSAYLVFTPKLLDPGYFNYLMRSYDAHKVFYSMGNGVRQVIGYSEVKRLPVLVPPPREQRSIAEYLDRETNKIDALVTKQRQLIETLRERRAAVIAHVVTKGLDADVAMADSGISWIGRVPIEWRVLPVKHVGDVTLGKMVQPEQRIASDEMMPYLRAANVQPNGVLAIDDIKSMWFAPAEVAALTLKEGDVVVVEGGVGGFGRAAYLHADLPRIGFQNSINRVRLNADTDGRFLTYFLLMARHAGYIAAFCNVVSMPHLTAEKLEAMRLPVPPPAEQARIADFLDEQTAKIDALIERSQRFIELSMERRSALISAAVTGQIDVRPKQAPTDVPPATMAPIKRASRRAAPSRSGLMVAKGADSGLGNV